MSEKISLSDVANSVVNHEETEAIKLPQQPASSEKKEDNINNRPVISMTQPGLSRPKVDINSLRNSRGQNKSNARTADLSSLPNSEKIPDGMNYKVKESIEAEIFEEGGIFDKYLDNRKKEYNRGIAEIKANIDRIKQEKLAAEEDKDIDEEYDIDNKNIENNDELEEIDKATVITNAKTYKKVDIRRSDKSIKKEENYMEDNIIRGNVQEFANPDMVKDEEYPIKIDIVNSKSTPAEEVNPEPVNKEPERIEDEDD